jgi:hypothetical protein
MCIYQQKRTNMQETGWRMKIEMIYFLAGDIFRS